MLLTIQTIGNLFSIAHSTCTSSNTKQVLWDQLRIILPHNTFELLTYDTRHGGVIAVKPNPFLECEFATLAHKS